MPQPPALRRSPKRQARMISGLPRPATTGSASVAPASASLRMSGSGLISLLIGTKPATMAPAGTAAGNGRAAITCAAAARASAGSASRRASACRRNSAFAFGGGGRVGKGAVRSQCAPRAAPCPRERGLGRLTRGHGARAVELAQLRKLVCVRAPLPTLPTNYASRMSAEPRWPSGASIPGSLRK